MAISADLESSLRAKFEAVLPHLDERSVRLVLAGEARSLGHGGIAAVARASGASRSRVQDGVAELESGQAPLDRVRRAGGGRKPAGQADPGLVPALLALVEPTRRGDPESALSWTTLSVRKLAAELTADGHKVSQETVAQLLRAEGFSLQGNAKQIEGGQHPDRDAQFSYLNDQAAGHQEAGEPAISVDTKKKELVGAYKTAARSGAQPATRSGSRCTTSSIPYWARPTPTASMTWRLMPAGSRWAPTTTPQRSRSTRSGPGGTAPASTPTLRRLDC